MARTLCPKCKNEVNDSFVACPHCGQSLVSASNIPKLEVEGLLREGKKIEAIKIYRERTGYGLKEAKDAVEEIEKEILPTIPREARQGCMSVFVLVLIGIGFLFLSLLNRL